MVLQGFYSIPYKSIFRDILYSCLLFVMNLQHLGFGIGCSTALGPIVQFWKTNTWQLTLQDGGFNSHVASCDIRWLWIHVRPFRTFFCTRFKYKYFSRMIRPFGIMNVKKMWSTGQPNNRPPILRRVCTTQFW